jgi:hypothetical protein
MSTKKRDENDEGPRSFTRALEMISEGSLVREASRQLHELLKTLQAEVRDTDLDAKGELTLTLKVTVEVDGIVRIDPVIKTKEPAPRLVKGTLWITKGGNLTPHNPRQQSLPLHEVKSDAPARDIDETGTEAREV